MHKINEAYAKKIKEVYEVSPVAHDPSTHKFKIGQVVEGIGAVDSWDLTGHIFLITDYYNAVHGNKRYLYNVHCVDDSEKRGKTWNCTQEALKAWAGGIPKDGAENMWV